MLYFLHVNIVKHVRFQCGRSNYRDVIIVRWIAEINPHWFRFLLARPPLMLRFWRFRFSVFLKKEMRWFFNGVICRPPPAVQTVLTAVVTMLGHQEPTWGEVRRVSARPLFFFLFFNVRNYYRRYYWGYHRHIMIEMFYRHYHWNVFTTFLPHYYWDHYQ